MKKIKTKKMSGADRREQIINIARHLFAKEKYQRTTMATIAKAIGVSEPLIYRHFQSKKDLFLVILKDCHETITSVSVEVLKQEGQVLELYQNLFNIFLNHMREDPDRAKVCILAAGLEDEDIRSEIQFFDQNIEKILVQDLKKREKALGSHCQNFYQPYGRKSPSHHD